MLLLLEIADLAQLLSGPVAGPALNRPSALTRVD